MKKVLLILFVLAICVLAFPQGVMAATIGKDNATVSATVTDYSSISAVWEGGTWNLLRGSNTVSPAINVTVDSSTPWSTTAADQNQGQNTGKMIAIADSTKFLGTTFNLNANPLTGSLAMGSGGAQAPTSRHYGVAQFVLPADDTQYTYQIVITFTLTST